MALINCPECHKSISDKANSCPNCGYPLDTQHANIDADASDYCLILKRTCGNYKEVFDLIQSINHINLLQTVELTQKLPVIVKDGMTYKEAHELLELFLVSGADVSIDRNSTTALDRLLLYCPKCGSTQITTGTKGYGIIRGFIGSNKTVNRCGKCGYSWEP